MNRKIPIQADESRRSSKSRFDPSSAELFKKAQAFLVDGYTRPLVSDPHPNYLDHGIGCWAVDVDGNKRIDYTNNFGALIHGYSHPKIVEAITTQAARATCSTMPTYHEAELAEIFVDRIPGAQKIRFSNTGTEAVILSLKMARAITGKAKIAKVEGSYHGQYELVESSFQPSPDDWGDPKRPNTVRRNFGTPNYMLDQLVVVPCNDLEATRQILSVHKDDIAAMIVDPMQLQLGYGKPSIEYLEMLRSETSRLGILLIFDEVVAFRNGFNGTQGRVGVLPDITVIGKFIGGGLPIGAVGGSDEVMSVFKISGHGTRILHSGTFSGNPLSMAAGAAAMRLLTKDAFQRLQTMSDRLCRGFSSILVSKGIDARLEQYCVGSAKLVFGSGPIQNWRQLHHYFQKHMRGKIMPLQNALLRNGVLASRLSFVMSTAMNEDDIDFTIDAFGAAAEETLPQLRGERGESAAAINETGKNALS